MFNYPIELDPAFKKDYGRQLLRRQRDQYIQVKVEGMNGEANNTWQIASIES
jgi:hypothetical protein